MNCRKYVKNFFKYSFLSFFSSNHIFDLYKRRKVKKHEKSYFIYFTPTTTEKIFP